MSWDFYMSVPVARDGGLIPLSGYNNLGYTYNVSPMYIKAFGNDHGIRWLHGKQGAAVIEEIDAAIARMKAEPDEYRKLNPQNGWGNYEGAVEVLETLVSWCREVPTAIVVVS